MLTIDNLCVRFGNGRSLTRPMVDRVDLHLDTGRTSAVIGESGSGKTLLGLSICNLLPDEANVEGTVSFAGQVLTGLDSRQMRSYLGQRIAYVPQSSGLSLNPTMRCDRQVTEVVRNRDRTVKKMANCSAGIMLSLHGIHKSYATLGGATVIANGVDLKVGKVFGLTGPSGSGKSTLGRLVLGLETPDKGRVLFDGQDISSFTRKKWLIFRKNVQLVPQHPDASFNPRRTLGVSLMEVFRFHEVCREDQQKEYLAAILEQVRIHPQLLSRYPSQLSGGELQRLAFARAILSKPRYLVLDELTSMLDVSVQATIIRTLESFKNHNKIGYLFITHNIELARIFCDRLSCLTEGKLSLLPNQDE